MYNDYTNSHEDPLRKTNMSTMELRRIYDKRDDFDFDIDMVMFLVRHPMVFIFLNLFNLLEFPVMLMAVIPVHSFNALIIPILRDCLPNYFLVFRICFPSTST